VFVGQRAESFSVNLGRIFDLINMVPIIGIPGGILNCQYNNVLAGYNIGSFILELPSVCISGPTGYAGIWATVRTLAHAPNNTAVHIPVQQVSRLGNPLVNEVVIGIDAKDSFNGAVPSNDGQFATFVTNPTLPSIISLLFAGALNNGNNIAPTNFPRQDLVTAFLTGVPGLNQGGSGVCEVLRLNTSIPATPPASQNSLGVIAGDNAGFPNGRRPGDDVIDIALRVMMGVLCTINLGFTPSQAQFGGLAYGDGAPVSVNNFKPGFPYLNDPLPGAVNAAPTGPCFAPDTDVCAQCLIANASICDGITIIPSPSPSKKPTSAATPLAVGAAAALSAMMLPLVL